MIAALSIFAEWEGAVPAEGAPLDPCAYPGPGPGDGDVTPIGDPEDDEGYGDDGDDDEDDEDDDEEDDEEPMQLGGRAVGRDATDAMQHHRAKSAIIMGLRNLHHPIDGCPRRDRTHGNPIIGF